MSNQEQQTKLDGGASASTAGLEPVQHPERIWLQPDPDDESVTEISDCSTWCRDGVGITDVEYILAGSGPDMAEELRSVMRWEGKRMGAVSMGVLRSVIARLEGSNVEFSGTPAALSPEAPLERRVRAH